MGAGGWLGPLHVHAYVCTCARRGASKVGHRVQLAHLLTDRLLPALAGRCTAPAHQPQAPVTAASLPAVQPAAAAAAAASTALHSQRQRQAGLQKPPHVWVLLRASPGAAQAAGGRPAAAHGTQLPQHAAVTGCRAAPGGEMGGKAAPRASCAGQLLAFNDAQPTLHDPWCFPARLHSATSAHAACQCRVASGGP